MEEPIVVAGLPERCRADAARLYLDAFWPKLGRLLGAERREEFARRAAPRLRADRVVCAFEGERLLGVAGWVHAGRGFFDLTLADLRAELGAWGGTWRGLLLGLLERRERAGELLMDGICVAEHGRGRGVGTRLLAAVEEEARRLGARAVRLDVIDSNPRARALYERLGYRAVREHRLGPLRGLFGFSSATEMHKPVR